MIASLRGTVQAVGPDYVIVQVGGVGLRVNAPTRTLTGLGGPGEEVYLQTHLYLRPDVVALYGFATPQEHQLFLLLTNVNGVGPRNALRLLSVLSPDELVSAILREDASTLIRVPGIGKKTAARISLELKGTLEQEWTALPGAPEGPLDTDAVAALTVLGYTLSEARGALVKLERLESLTLEEQIAGALQRLGES